MPIRTNARRRARFSTRIRQVGVDVTGARLVESDESFSIAGSLWYCALRLLAMSIHRYTSCCPTVGAPDALDLGVVHADDACNISARSVWGPSSTSSDRLAIRSSTAEDMQRRALVFPIRAGPGGSRTPPGYKALAIRPQQTRDSTSTTHGRVCPVRHLNRDPDRGQISKQRSNDCTQRHNQLSRISRPTCPRCPPSKSASHDSQKGV